MLKLFIFLILFLFLKPVFLYADQGNLKNIKNICNFSNGIHTIDFEDPIRNKQIRIMNGLKEGNSIFYIRNSHLISRKYPLNFSYAYLWKYDCKTGYNAQIFNQNMFSFLENGVYQMYSKYENRLYFGLYRDTMSTFSPGYFDLNQNTFIQKIY